MTNPATVQQRIHNLHGGPYWSQTGFGEWLYYWAECPPRKKWSRRGEILNRVCERIFGDVISHKDTYTPFDSTEALRDFIRDPRECDAPIIAALKAEHIEFWKRRGQRVAA